MIFICYKTTNFCVLIWPLFMTTVIFGELTLTASKEELISFRLSMPMLILISGKLLPIALEVCLSGGIN